MEKNPIGNVYNRFAGHSLERLAALSDGIFAVVMTLLVLDLHVPAGEEMHSEGDLWNALVKFSPRLLTYFMSFMTLGIFWVGQQTQLNKISHSNRNFTWIHLAFLLTVAIMPFSTSLLAEFIDYRIALVVYWFNILLAGGVLFISWRYAIKAELLKAEATEEVRIATERRIIIAQSLYAFGALLCIFSTYLSIAVIVLIQLNYVIAPRIKWLYRL